MVALLTPRASEMRAALEGSISVSGSRDHGRDNGR